MNKDEIVNQLVGLKCIKLRSLNDDRPKAAYHRNYTTNQEIWSLYPVTHQRYGVLLKPNKLIVVDIDDVEKLDYTSLPSTFTVQTGGGGYHLYYFREGDGWDKLDCYHPFGEIKQGGHVVGVGVTHDETGNIYSVINDVSIRSIYYDELRNSLDENGAENESKEYEKNTKKGEEGRARAHVSDEKKKNAKKKNRKNFDLQKKFTQRIEEEKPEKFKEVFLSLRCIRKWSWRRGVVARLVADKPTHAQRQWIVGFLKDAVELDSEEVFEIIDEYCEWVDYEEEETRYQINSLYSREE